MTFFKVDWMDSLCFFVVVGMMGFSAAMDIEEEGGEITTTPYHSVSSCNQREDLGKDKEDTLHHFKTAAAQGDVASQYHLGNMFLNGTEGVEKNIEEAIRYYEMASSQGNFSTCIILKLIEGGVFDYPTNKSH